VLFLDPDLEPLNENWLSVMGEQLSNPKIGAVGSRIVSSGDAIESAGLILSPNGSVGSAFGGYPRNFRGANRQLQAVRNYSAVSASCLLTRREVLEKTASDNAIGSLDFARDDRVCIGTEFCLNLREHGLRTVSIPYAEVRRISARENVSRMCLDLQKRWPEMFRRDPYYNPNLSSERADFSLR
jgi:GT2 family glycosyltransferase